MPTVHIPSSAGSVSAVSRDWPGVRDWPLEGLTDAEEALGKRAAGLREYAEAVTDHPGVRESAWSGAASEAARALVATHMRQSAVLADSARTALRALRAYRSGAEELRTKAQEAEAAAKSHGMAIAADGSVSSASAPLKGLYAKSVAQRLSAQAADLLARAAALDRELAEALAGSRWAGRGREGDEGSSGGATGSSRPIGQE